MFCKIEGIVWEGEEEGFWLLEEEEEEGTRIVAEVKYEGELVILREGGKCSEVAAVAAAAENVVMDLFVRYYEASLGEWPFTATT